MSCPICGKRKPTRFCPAKGASICTICCGTEREVTLDCPADCIYLIRAREQEQEHRKPIPRGEVPFEEIDLPTGVVDANHPLLGVMSTAILGVAAQAPHVYDADVAAALRALGEAYRTLTSGLYYERPPEGGPSRDMYMKLRETVQELRKEQLARAALPVVKDSDALFVTIFLARVLRHRSNGRPRCCAFLEFLRSQFPQAAPVEKDAPRIIVP